MKLNQNLLYLDFSKEKKVKTKKSQYFHIASNAIHCFMKKWCIGNRPRVLRGLYPIYLRETII